MTGRVELLIYQRVSQDIFSYSWWFLSWCTYSITVWTWLVLELYSFEPAGLPTRSRLNETIVVWNEHHWPSQHELWYDLYCMFSIYLSMYTLAVHSFLLYLCLFFMLMTLHSQAAGTSPIKRSPCQDECIEAPFDINENEERCSSAGEVTTT